MRPLLIALALLLPLAAPAQESKKKPTPKPLVFQPGAKVPEGHETQAKATPSPTPAPTPTPAPKGHPMLVAEVPEVAKSVDDFFTLVNEGKVDAAYELLTRNSVIAEKPADVTLLKDKTKQAIQIFGAIGGYDVVAIRWLGPHLIQPICISLGEKFPLRWRFYFYRPGQEWRLIDIQVDDRLADLFAEPAPTPAPTPNGSARK